MARAQKDTLAPEVLLARALGEGDLQLRLEALRSLSSHRAILQTVSARENFRTTLRAVAEQASRRTDSTDPLLVVTILTRLRAAVPMLAGLIDELLSQLLKRPLPSLSLLTDPDDRGYVVLGLEFIDKNWMIDSLAEWIIVDNANQVRDRGIRVLLFKSGSIEKAFGQLAAAMQRWSPDTETPNETAIRRLKRVLKAARETLAVSWAPVGDEPGRSLARLVSSSWKNSAPALDVKLINEVVDESLFLIGEMIGLHLSLSLKMHTYDAIDVVMRWFTPVQARRYLEKPSAALLRIRENIGDALELLSLQGKTDDDLIGRLSRLYATSEELRDARHRLAERDGIPVEVRSWLLGGERNELQRDRSNTELSSRSRREDDDSALSQLLLDAQRLSVLGEAVTINHLPQIRMILPQSSNQVESLSGLARAVAEAVRAFGAFRGLRLGDEVGSIVEFIPTDHELLGDATPAIRRVRIVRPLVERVEQDRIIVVRRALVEAVS